ncbi:accessory gland protein Acp29AB-like [Drosophila tropicalis]|uniref:accessory gland protein Acp29AB-like n=1 Tax=Drosophila tropicalis TaxID=46794 RepID=UPI0035AB720A
MGVLRHLEVCEAARPIDVVERLEKIQALLVTQQQQTQSLVDSQARAPVEHQLATLEKMETHLDRLNIQQSQLKEQLMNQNLKDSADKMRKLESQLAILEEKLSSAESALSKSERKLQEQTHLVDKYREARLKSFQRIGSKYYYIDETERLSWEASSRRCRQMGGHLVSLQSKVEYEAVNMQLRSGEIYWTDVNDQVREGLYVSHTGYVANFLHWRLSPDNYNNEDCIELIPHMGMNDNNCNYKNNFICEISAELE